MSSQNQGVVALAKLREKNPDADGSRFVSVVYSSHVDKEVSSLRASDEGFNEDQSAAASVIVGISTAKHTMFLK